MNFFLKYLYAQYKTHDVSDWIGENTNNNGLEGFKWRAGRKRETLGIWMWSDVFTHDFENGEKVAIILLDTQGVFDDQSSVKDCTTIFSLSMMLSSVQCYNLMQNIQEDDLQHLELFTEYGRLALEQTNEKPFQNLLFIVRDWPFAFETEYGWPGQQVVDEVLAGNDDQTPEMRQLRQRIQSSFEKITAFLMPHPGMTVARGNTFNGDIQQIDPEFIKYVKELMPALFAPENLIVKKINGEKVRARDLLQYLQTYTNIFNGDALPEPKSVLMATAEASNTILLNDCVNFYGDSMQRSVDNVDPFFKEHELMETHQRLKSETMAKFMEKPKLGGDEMTASFQRRIEESTEGKLNAFKAQNEQKRAAFIEKANLHNNQLVSEMFERVRRRVIDEADHPASDAVHGHLHNIFNAERQAALDEFTSRKMGDDEISNGSRAKLELDLNNFQSGMSQTLDAFNHWSNHYNNRMQESLNGVEYFSAGDFSSFHQNLKNEAVSQFQSQPGDNELKFKLQPKIERSIDDKLPHFDGQNGAKRNSFTERANAHHDAVSRETRASFENKMRSSIGGAYLNDADFINLFLRIKQESLQEFASRKMGEDEISNQTYHSFRENLERELDGLQAAMKQVNEANKPPPPPPPPRRKRRRGFLKKIFG